LIVEAGLIVTYVTMGIAPVIYNIIAAKRALKKRMDEDHGQGEGEDSSVELQEEDGGFTLTVPCTVTSLHTSDGDGRVVRLNIKLNHVKRVLRQG